MTTAFWAFLWWKFLLILVSLGVWIMNVEIKTCRTSVEGSQKNSGMRLFDLKISSILTRRRTCRIIIFPPFPFHPTAKRQSYEKAYKRSTAPVLTRKFITPFPLPSPPSRQNLFCLCLSRLIIYSGLAHLSTMPPCIIWEHPISGEKAKCLQIKLELRFRLPLPPVCTSNVWGQNKESSWQHKDKSH